MTARARDFRRVMENALAVGVTRDQISEVVAALKGGTDPDELALALSDYVPYSSSLLDIPVNVLMGRA